MGEVFDIRSDSVEDPVSSPGAGAGDGAGDGADVDDVLDVGHAGHRWSRRLTGERRRVPRRARIALWSAGAAGLAAAVALTGAGAGTRPEARSSRPPAAAHRATPAPPTDKQVDLANVLALAGRRGPATDYVRQNSPTGACALVPVGHSPTAAITRAVRDSLPGFRMMTIGRTLDQFTGLCSVEMRSARTSGSVLVVSIASPAASAPGTFDLVRTGSETTARASTTYVLAVTRGGWSVLIGATGVDAALPPVQDLLELAQQPALTW